jgi:hypothetical protein
MRVLLFLSAILAALTGVAGGARAAPAAVVSQAPLRAVESAPAEVRAGAPLVRRRPVAHAARTPLRARAPRAAVRLWADRPRE